MLLEILNKGRQVRVGKPTAVPNRYSFKHVWATVLDPANFFIYTIDGMDIQHAPSGTSSNPLCHGFEMFLPATATRPIIEVHGPPVFYTYTGDLFEVAGRVSGAFLAVVPDIDVSDNFPDYRVVNCSALFVAPARNDETTENQYYRIKNLLWNLQELYAPLGVTCSAKRVMPKFAERVNHTVGQAILPSEVIAVELNLKLIDHEFAM